MCKRVATCQLPWPDRFDFPNLEELRINALTDVPGPQSTQSFLQSLLTPCLRRVTVEVLEKNVTHVQWSSLDANLVNLVERHRAYGNILLQISTTADPDKILGMLPRAAQEGVMEVRFSERPDYCTVGFQ